MTDKNFNNIVLAKLDSIESRLESLESKIDEATNFADSFLGEEGFSAGEGVEAIRDTFANLLSGSMASSGVEADGDSMVDLVSSLKSFQERLSSVKDAISDLPNEDD
tara:strand:- start:5233 stop:5553 length:321 start_codon:yes stop_codon:yes gene_type:complete